MSRNLELAVPSYSRSIQSRVSYRRQFFAVMLATCVCDQVNADSPTLNTPELSPPVAVPAGTPTTTTLQIRNATRPWADTKPEDFEPALRFRSPALTVSDRKPQASKPSTTSGGQSLHQRAGEVIPPATIPPATRDWMTTDNWVAREAVNRQQPLRDPAATAEPTVPTSSQPPSVMLPPAALKPMDTPQAVQSEATKPTLPIRKPTLVETKSPSPLEPVSPPQLNLLRQSGPSALTPAQQTPPESECGYESNASSGTAEEALGNDLPALNAPNRDEAEPTPEPTANSHSKSGDENGTVDDRDSAEVRDSVGGVPLRPLRITRDGKPTDRVLDKSIRGLLDRSQVSSIYVGDDQPPENREMELRDAPEKLHEGDNEPKQRFVEEIEIELDEEQSARLTTPERVEKQPSVPHDVELDYTGRAVVKMPLTAPVRQMQPVMRACLSYYHAHPDDASERSNWGMMHQIMVYGADTNIKVGRNSHNAIAWIAGNNACRGQKLLVAGPRGIEAKSGVGLQGHQGQFLAVLSLCGVPDTYPLYSGRTRFTVRDLVRREAAACKSGEELTFTLIALSHYLSSDESWIASDGQTWDCERLIREELSQPIVGVACGGTHRLMGLAHSLRNRRGEGGEITGQWLRVEKFLDEFVDYTYQLQNRDGSMSTSWFEERGDNGELDRKVQTTGHMVEWLLTYTPDSELQNPRLVAAVRFLLNAMESDHKHDWQPGPKGHALRSLAMYYDRVYRSGRAWSRPTAMARSGNSTRR